MPAASMTSNRPAPVRIAAAWLPRALAYIGIVFIVTEGNVSGWPVLGTVAALVAAIDAAASGWRSWNLRPLAALQFGVYFLLHSVRAGFDVAWRALHPRLPIAPGMASFELRLTDPASRVLLANVLSLLPGTLAVELEHGTLHLHLLDKRLPAEPSLRELERRIARLQGVALDATADASGGVAGAAT
jgi:multicomponent Na+:H+ antiporter subunit E